MRPAVASWTDRRRRIAASVPNYNYFRTPRMPPSRGAMVLATIEGAHKINIDMVTWGRFYVNYIAKRRGQPPQPIEEDAYVESEIDLGVQAESRTAVYYDRGVGLFVYLALLSSIRPAAVP